MELPDKIQIANQFKENLIEHLSNEITNLTNARITLRNRVISIIYIGPFIILGSMFLSNKDLVMAIQLTSNHWVLILITFLIWILLGLGTGWVEHGIWEKCNEWRNLILKVQSSEEEIVISRDQFIHTQGPISLIWAYFIVYCLLAIALISISILIFDILT